MKLFLTLCILFLSLLSFSQEESFQLEGQLIGINGLPVSDAYLINSRNKEKDITNIRGIFSIRVQPADSLIISHISYNRKVVTVFQLLVNPIVVLVTDSVNIKEINILSNQKTDAEKAMENIKSIEFDFRPQPDDQYTENERMQNLVNTENRVERAASNSLNFAKFSPSEHMSKLLKRIKKKDKTQEFSSTRKLKKQESK